MRIAIILAATVGLARAACISVPSSNIVARDISRAVPLFQQLDPETPIGFTPFPGIQRVLSSRELFGIAARYGLSFPPGETAPSVCVQRAVRTLSAPELKPVLLSALGIPAVQMEILEVSSQLVPPGRLEFRREGLNRPPGGNPQSPVIWRGRLVYDGQHSLAIWAKVRLAVSRQMVAAVEEIPAGTAIRPDQIKSIVSPQFPELESSSNPQLTTEKMVGMVARRRIAAGGTIEASALEYAKDISRGETVHVSVIDGGATISLDGVAEASGNKGQTIVVHNPSNGKNFRALIAGKGQVVVRLASGAVL